MRPKQQRHFVSSQRIDNLHLRARVSRTHLRLNDFPTRSLVRARPNRRLLRAATKAPRRKRPCRPRPPAIGPKFVRSARMEPLNDTIAPVIVVRCLVVADWRYAPNDPSQFKSGHQSTGYVTSAEIVPGPALHRSTTKPQKPLKTQATTSGANHPPHVWSNASASHRGARASFKHRHAALRRLPASCHSPNG